MWAQKQKWVCPAEGLISISSLDHFVTTSAANPLPGGGKSAIMLPGVTFKTKSICMSLVFCCLADISPSFFHLPTDRIAFVHQNILGKDDHIDGGQAHFVVN